MLSGIKQILGIAVFVAFFSSCQNQSAKKNEGCIMLTDSYKRTVHLSKSPERIISAAPGITEIIFALHQEKKLVGRTDYCKFPAEVSKIPSIGGLQDPSIETIVKLNPDLVIASTHFKKETVEQLEKLKIPIVVEKGQESFEGAFKLISTVGDILSAKPQADSIVSKMKEKITVTTQKAAKAVKKPKVYIVIGFGKTGDYTAGGNTFISELIEMAAGQNIAKDVTGWAYSLEKIIENDPDYIIIRPGDKALFMKSPNYKNLTAVKSGKVFEVDNNLFELTGPRLADGLETLFKIIHPEIN